LKIDFERMIACKKDQGGKEFKINRKNINDTEINLLDSQFDKNEWRQVSFQESNNA